MKVREIVANSGCVPHPNKGKGIGLARLLTNPLLALALCSRLNPMTEPARQGLRSFQRRGVGAPHHAVLLIRKRWRQRRQVGIAALQALLSHPMEGAHGLLAIIDAIEQAKGGDGRHRQPGEWQGRRAMPRAKQHEARGGDVPRRPHPRVDAGADRLLLEPFHVPLLNHNKH